MKNITIIGAGNVAWHLSHSFAESGHRVVQIISRSKKSAKKLADELGCPHSTNLKKIDQSSDVVLICVNDDEISKVAKAISSSIPKQAVLAHTSGSVSKNVLRPATKHFGVFYPLQTFTTGRKLNMKVVPVLIEGSGLHSLRILKHLAKSLSEKVFKVDEEKRKMVHLAAVFANNFTHHLFVMADEFLRNKKLPNKILMPLIEETAKRIISAVDLKLMQTGPAKRRDQNVITQQLKMLRSFKRYRDVYRILTSSIQKFHEK